MHLNTGIIESIEENDFDTITAPIFVKGYLRAYARIVLLDEDEMITQYIEAFSDDDPILNTTSNMAVEITAGDARVKWTTTLVILALIVLLGIWWWNKSQNRTDVYSLDAEQAETITQSDGAEDTMLKEKEIEIVSGTTVGTSNETSKVQSIDVEPEPPVSVEKEVLAVEANPDDSDSGSALSEDTQQGEIVDAVVTEDSRVISRLAPSGSDQLLITVYADTWADIKDSSDYQLVYDLLRAGQEVKITGAAPFAVFLGNGHGVEITFNDEIIDVTSRTRDDNTSRLKIGS